MNFIRLSHANSIFVDLLALCGFLAQISLLHILRYNKTISILAATLSKSFSDVVNIPMLVEINRHPQTPEARRRDLDLDMP